MTGFVGLVTVALLWGVVLAGAAERGARRLSERLIVGGGASSVPADGRGRARRLPVAASTRTDRGWWRELQHRRRRRHRDAQVVVQLPDVVDLLRLTTAAGLPAGRALIVVGARPGGPVGEAFHRSAVGLDRGAALADVLPPLAEACGGPARSLLDALVDHERYGTPLGPALDRLAVESRLKRRRQAEEAARRLPVLLLFPLVFTTLPAFLLLAVVPLVAGSLTALGR